MSYKKKFLNRSGVASPISGINSNSGAWNSPATSSSMNSTDFGYKNYMSRLPEVYTGHPNRIERYNSYEMMDVDAEINACLDIIAEFSTQRNEHNKTPFSFEFKEEPTPHEVELLSKQLQQWSKLNEFDVRIFKIFRNVVKYGDQVFVRDPENFKLYWVDMVKVIKVIVNESEGKLPEQYVLKDLNINLQNLSVAQKTNTDFAANPATGSGGTGGGTNAAYTVPSMPYNTTGSRFTLGQSEASIDSKHIVHLSLTEGLDRFWPFGQSILENIFKVYKQKELLEDAVLIYRVQRAPERRMFKIDVGNMPSHLAMAFVERVKNEIHQRRIPSTYGGSSVVDATYNPLCITLDTVIPLLDGRKLPLQQLIEEHESGKENWVYSCDPITGKIMPGNITWAGVTRKNTDVIKLTFDNGKTLTCTPDHKIPVLGKGYVEAKDLTTADSLIAFNTKETPILLSIEYLDEKVDTGCITVDGDNRWHGNHNFAIESGIFIKNSMNEDYFFPVTAEGRGSSVEVLPGGQNLGEIDDLKYFNNRLARGLRVPSSYLPTGPDDNTTPLSDGRVGTAMIQEFRFNQYCERLQNYLSRKLDEEFKLFLRWRGFNIDTGLFNITFNPPQNFAAYRQSELDNARVATYQTMEAFPYISKRFALERFLGLSEEEIKKNERMWQEENKDDVSTSPEGKDLRNIGVSSGDFQSDLDTADQAEEADTEQAPGPELAGPVSGAEGAADAGAGAGPVGGGGGAAPAGGGGAMQI